jgi:hypothetical protein
MFGSDSYIIISRLSPIVKFTLTDRGEQATRVVLGDQSSIG